MAILEEFMTVHLNVEASDEHARAFVRAEVRKALADETETLYQTFKERLSHDLRFQSAGLPPKRPRRVKAHG